MATKDRIFYFDVLRAFAIIGVIICHVNLFFGPLTTTIEIISQQTFHDLGRMGVPIFLMISGALLLNRNYELSNFLKKRFKRIIFPFIFWFILITLVNLYSKKNFTFIWKTFVGTPSITWYFWTLIGIYLFIPIINTFIKEYGEKGCEYFLAIWFITMIMKTFNSYPLLPHLDLNYFADYIGFPILGYYLSNKQFKINDLKIIIIGFLILLISLIILVYIDCNSLNFINIEYLSLPIIFMSTGLYLFIKYLDEFNLFESIKNNFIGNTITSLSICSYGMYFSHVIIITLLSYHNPKSTILFPAVFILIIFLSWLLPYLLSKIPYIKIFSGV